MIAGPPDHASVLIDWMCYPAVGHALEAYKHALGYLALNPSLDVHVVLPPTVATSLAPPGITVHSVSLRLPEPDVRRLPKEWDYLITDGRLLNLGEEHKHLREARLAVEDHVHVRKAAGVASSALGAEANHAPPPVLPYRPNYPLRLTAPPLRSRGAALAPNGVNICILPAGSSPERSPSMATWRAVCQAIQSRHREPVTFHFTGRTATSRTRARLSRVLGRKPAPWTTWTPVERREIDLLARGLDRAQVWWDCGFDQQLALISSCDLLIAPHTGFAFLAGALGTPWLTLSCCRWPEYYFDPTPFYSVFPTCPSYPSLGDDTGCTSGTARNGCLKDLAERGDEIYQAAEWLMRPDTTYEQCVRRHLGCIDDHPQSERFYFFDGRENLLVHQEGTADFRGIDG